MPSNDKPRTASEVKVVVQNFPPQDGGRKIGTGGTNVSISRVPPPAPPALALEERVPVVFLRSCGYMGQRVLAGTRRLVPPHHLRELETRGWAEQETPGPVAVPVPKVDRNVPPPVEVVIVAPVEDDPVMIADEGPEVEAEVEAEPVVDAEDEPTPEDAPDEDDETAEQQPAEDLLAMVVEQNEAAGPLPTFGMAGPRQGDIEEEPAKRKPGRPRKQPRTP